MNINPKDITCPWCETHKLEVYGGERRGTVFLGCSTPAEFNCPDTTGECETVEEAMGYAKELCKPKGLWPLTDEEIALENSIALSKFNVAKVIDEKIDRVNQKAINETKFLKAIMDVDWTSILEDEIVYCSDSLNDFMEQPHKCHFKSMLGSNPLFEVYTGKRTENSDAGISPQPRRADCSAFDYCLPADLYISMRSALDDC